MDLIFKHFVIKIFVWVRIQIGSGFCNQLDPNPDSSKYPDPGFNKYGFETMTAARLRIKICIISGS
jgi:hypothetical protein